MGGICIALSDDDFEYEDKDDLYVNIRKRYGVLNGIRALSCTPQCALLCCVLFCAVLCSVLCYFVLCAVGCDEHCALLCFVPCCYIDLWRRSDYLPRLPLHISNHDVNLYFIL